MIAADCESLAQPPEGWGWGGRRLAALIQSTPARQHTKVRGGGDVLFTRATSPAAAGSCHLLHLPASEQLLPWEGTGPSRGTAAGRHGPSETFYLPPIV